MKHEIEKGIPIPQTHHSQITGITTTLRQMEVGDSVWFSKETKHLCGYFSRFPMMRFCSRSETKGETKGARVWRIK
jgi:hypothetical protein